MATLNGVPASPDQLEALGLANYGHFTALQVEGGGVRGYSLHLERLARDCREVFGVDLDQAAVRAYVRQAVEDSGRDELGIRVTVFAPDMDLSRPGATEPGILVSVRPAAQRPSPPLRVQSRRYEREHPGVKHIALFGTLSERRAARAAGFDDAVFMDGARFLSEGPTWNIGFYDGERIIWPSAEVLPGITMRLLKRVHEDSLSAPINLRDIPQMRAAFVTNVTVGVRPLAGIDGVSFPTDSPILDVLRREFEEIPREEI